MELGVCVDYRRLNSLTTPDRYPLPRIEDLFALISGCKFFTTLDPASGYWQVAMNESDIPKTAFRTHRGLFEFLVMSFGLCGAPADCQRAVDTVVGENCRDFACAFIDDTLIFSKTFDDQLVHIEKVFDAFCKANLKFKPSKCRFGCDTVAYLGHIVTAGGVKPDPAKVEALVKFPKPKYVKDVQSIYGLSSYFRKFIRKFATLAYITAA